MSNNCAIDRIDNKSILYILITLSILTKGFNEMKTWIFKTSEDAYNFTMSDDRINVYEDILVIPSENIVGIASVYPFAISKKTGCLHTNSIINYTMLNSFDDHINGTASKFHNRTAHVIYNHYGTDSLPKYNDVTFPDLHLLICNAYVIAKVLDKVISEKDASEIENLLIKHYDGIVHDGWWYTSEDVKTEANIDTIKKWVNNLTDVKSYEFSQNDKERVNHIVNNVINNP